MDDLLSYGVESLGDMLKGNANTRMAFRSVTNVMKDISKLIDEENKGIMVGLLREYQIPYTIEFTSPTEIRGCVLARLRIKTRRAARKIQESKGGSEG